MRGAARGDRPCASESGGEGLARAPGLAPTGSFEAAEARYAGVGDIDRGALRLWIAEAPTIQWDYKNIAKRKGVLERLC